MFVEIMREDEVLVKYLLPWNTRVQGKYLSVPGDGGADPRFPTPGVGGSSMNPLAKNFDSWKGFNRLAMGVWKTDKLYLCVPGVDSMPNRKVRSTVPLHVIYCIHRLTKNIDDIMITFDFAVFSFTYSISPRYWNSFSTI